jgi:hypothetical protein
MTTAAQQPSRSTIAASLWSVSITVMLAAITHAYEFGSAAFVVAAVVIAILFVLSSHYRRAGNRLVLVVYGLLNLWVIGGFGLVGGLWNHAVKVAVSLANGGALPVSLERCFMSPDLGSATYEALGILTFGASMVAANFGYRFARTVRWTGRAESSGQERFS